MSKLTYEQEIINRFCSEYVDQRIEAFYEELYDRIITGDRYVTVLFHLEENDLVPKACHISDVMLLDKFYGFDKIHDKKLVYKCYRNFQYSRIYYKIYTTHIPIGKLSKYFN